MIIQTKDEHQKRNATTYPDLHPSLESQFRVTDIDNRLLGGIQKQNSLDNAKFNGCLTSYNGELLLAYRAYSHKLNGRSNIFITRLTSSLGVKENIELDLPAYSPTNRQYEDPRLFIHRGKLHVSYVAVEYEDGHGGQTKWWAAMHVVRLDRNLKVEEHFLTRFDGNGVDNRQKNWVYFSHEGQLYCIHDTRCHRLLKLDDKLQVIDVTVSHDIQWPRGHMRGGTTPLPLGDGKYLSLLHSSVDHNQRIRRYSMTPYIFTIDKILSIGRTIHASTENPIVDPTATWWHPIVVFPMGIVERQDSYLVSVGVNDLYTTILEWPKDDLMRMRPADEFYTFQPRYFYWPKCTNTAKFSHYKILKVGGQGTVICGCVDNPENYAWINENIRGLEWISEEEYNNL